MLPDDRNMSIFFCCLKRPFMCETGVFLPLSLTSACVSVYNVRLMAYSGRCGGLSAEKDHPPFFSSILVTQPAEKNFFILFFIFLFFIFFVLFVQLS